MQNNLTKTDLGGLELLYYMLATIIYSARFSIYIIKRSGYATKLLFPRYVKFISHELGLLVPIFKGSNIVFLDPAGPAHVDNYHTRYEQSARGNVGENEWGFAGTKVKVGA